MGTCYTVVPSNGHTEALTYTAVTIIIALSDGINDANPLGPVRSLRTIRHGRNLKRLFLLHKDARLRSGARGMAARKTLTAFEKTTAESKAL